LLPEELVVVAALAGEVLVEVPVLVVLVRVLDVVDVTIEESTPVVAVDPVADEKKLPVAVCSAAAVASAINETNFVTSLCRLFPAASPK
jgi:Na+/H+-dicarboxylate symporter